MGEMKNVPELPRFVYGSFNQRVLAYLIDILLINAVASLIYSIYRIFGWSDTGMNLGLFHLTGLILYLAYFVLLTKLTDGQTLGKMIVGLRVVSLNHTELSWSDVFTRELLGRYIQKKLLILYFFVFFTKRKETLADLFTDTVVISEKAYLDLQEFIHE